MNILPEVFNWLVGAKVASQRIQKFLLAEEIQPYIQSANHPIVYNYSNSEKKASSNCRVVIREGNFSWKEDKAEITLKDITIGCEDRKLTVIVGPVGAGK